MNLKFNLTEVDTSRPNLQPGQYLGRIESWEIAAGKTVGKRNLILKVVVPRGTSTKAAGNGLEGDLVNYTMTKYYPLQQSDNPKAPDFRTDICRLVDAITGNKEQLTRPDLDDALAVLDANKNMEFIVGVGMSKGDDTYGPSSEIKSIKAVEVAVV